MNTGKKNATSDGARANSQTDRIVAPIFMTIRKLLKKPAPLDWLIAEILPANAIVGFVGPVESYKSAVICDIAVSIASGDSWHGHKVKSGPVLVLAGEGQSGFARRLKAIESHRGTSLAKTQILISSRGIGLVSRPHASALLQRLDRVAKKLGKPPAVVVVDTVARNFAPGDENSAVDMSAFIENVDRIRRRYRCTVILVHHTGHGDKTRARGSSAFKAALDHEVVFDRKQNQVTLRCTKSKDSAPFKPISLDAKKVALPWKDADGEPETSFVLRAADVSAISGVVPEKQIAIFRILRRLMSESVKKNGLGKARRQSVPNKDWFREVLAKGIVSDERAFDKLKAKLKSKRKIKADGDGYVIVE